MLYLDTHEGDPSNALYLACGWTEADRLPNRCTGLHGGRAATVFYDKLLD